MATTTTTTSSPDISIRPEDPQMPLRGPRPSRTASRGSRAARSLQVGPKRAPRQAPVPGLRGREQLPKRPPTRGTAEADIWKAS
eukprot:2156859-Pyramimonas_sp.AAC.1